jgi:hypothetical protein
MYHAIDLEKRAFTFTSQGITGIGTWVRTGNGFRPCMVLIPAGRELDEWLIPCVVMMDRAWIWSEEVGDPAEAARTAINFAEALGYNPYDRRAVFRIARLINDHLDDLLKIPPYTETQTVADVIITNTATGQVTEAEIRD